MPRHDSNRRKAAGVALAILLLGVLLAACGGGGSGSTSSASSTKTSTNNRSQFGARATALRTCLKKAGITLPERKPGKPGTNGAQRPGGPFGSGGGGKGGGFQLPKGVTQKQLQAALKKCGGGNFAGGGRRLGGARNAQQLAKFATCMRSNGVKLPAPNTSGKGPIFSTKGIDTTSSAFRQAETKCAKELRPAGAAAGAAPGGAAGAPGAGGAPGAAGGEPGQPAAGG